MKYAMAMYLGLVAALLLSACAGQQQMVATTTPAAPPNWQGITSTQMVFEGQTANIALSNKSLLRKALKDYKADSDPNTPPNPSLKDLISEIEWANQNPTKKVPGMTGMGGVLGQAFLRAANQALAGGNFNRQTRVEISMSGQIEYYKFTRNPSDPNRGQGELIAITYITRTVIPAGAGTPNAQTEAYKWDIEVEQDGYQVVPKGTNATDPFPNTIPFDSDMINRINTLGFTRKLWARGQKINIRKIWHKANANSPTWSQLSASNPHFSKLFERNDDNCIDMLFVGEPPEELDGLGPPFYCLGRCANPLIVNTGV